MILRLLLGLALQLLITVAANAGVKGGVPGGAGGSAAAGMPGSPTKGEPHINQDGRARAREKIKELQDKWAELQKKPNKTPEDKEELKTIGKQIKGQKLKAGAKGETHSMKGKGQQK